MLLKMNKKKNLYVIGMLFLLIVCCFAFSNKNYKKAKINDEMILGYSIESPNTNILEDNCQNKVYERKKIFIL